MNPADCFFQVVALTFLCLSGHLELCNCSRDLAHLSPFLFASSHVGSCLTKFCLKSSATDVIQQLIPLLVQGSSVSDESEPLTAPDLSKKNKSKRKRSAEPLLVRMMHSRDGLKLGILCIKHGTAKVCTWVVLLVYFALDNLHSFYYFLLDSSDVLQLLYCN